MKKKDLQNFKEKSETDLRKELETFRERLMALRFDLAAGKVKNIREIKAVRKSIARTLTILNTKKK